MYEERARIPDNISKAETVMEKASHYETAEWANDKELLQLLLPRVADEKIDNVLSLIDRGDVTKSGLLAAGIKDDLAQKILAAVELGRRHMKKFGFVPVIHSPSDIFHVVQSYGYRDQEHLIVLALNGAHEVLKTYVSTVGIANKTIVHPREVFAEALKLKAVAVAMAHNHPSGDLTPSNDDINVTKRIRVAGEILGIKLLDHIIFSPKDFYSFKEHLLLEE